MFTTATLFDLTQLPPELHAFFESCPSPLEALNPFPQQLLAPLKGTGLVNHQGNIQPGAIIRGDVHISPGAVIHAGAVINGEKAPVFIGKNTEVGPHASLRNGVYLAAGCVIGHGADVKNTLALPGAKIQINTFVGDSLLGRGARIGSGTILSNRKFNQSAIKIDLGNGVIESGRDFLGAIMGDQSRLGANVTLSPGSIIGMHSWVGSGCVIHGSIPADTLVTVKQELDQRPKSRIELNQ